MQIRLHFCFFVLISLATGCATQSHTQNKSQMGNLLLAEPAPADQRSQMAIARYNQILAQAPLQAEERAEFLLQRGMLYDSVGLGVLAQFDFQQAIKLKPDMADAYNSIGIHYTQQREFIQAYEAFDSTLDIDPSYEYAFLNRGIALYYGGRADLAVRDLTAFYQINESDPYRLLWRFIAEYDVDKVQALNRLQQSRSILNQNSWATALVDLYLGQVTEAELLDNLMVGVQSHKQLTDRLCEAYFYLGKFHSAQGNRGIASNYFKLALSTNVYEYVEHRYARLELSLLREQTKRDLQAVR